MAAVGWLHEGLSHRPGEGGSVLDALPPKPFGKLELAGLAEPWERAYPQRLVPSTAAPKYRKQPRRLRHAEHAENRRGCREAFRLKGGSAPHPTSAASAANALRLPTLSDCGLGAYTPWLGRVTGNPQARGLYSRRLGGAGAPGRHSRPGTIKQKTSSAPSAFLCVPRSRCFRYLCAGVLAPSS